MIKFKLYVTDFIINISHITPITDANNIENIKHIIKDGDLEKDNQYKKFTLKANGTNLISSQLNSFIWDNCILVNTEHIEAKIKYIIHI